MHLETRRVGQVVFALSLVLTSFSSVLGAGAGVPERRTPVVDAVSKVMPTVVSISSEKRAASLSRWPFSNEESQRPRINGMGTGVIIDGRGYILTNQHVVHQVQSIEVRLADGSNYPGRVVQQDESMDIAVVKIDAGRPLPAIAIGASADLMIGEQVITIGNAFGYENTVSTGIVSQLNRDVRLADDQVYRNLIQTDACINPGNSGGPLVNVDGELIGINVAVRAGAQGIGFALPIDDVKKVAAEMMSTRRLAQTWHGMIATEAARRPDHARAVLLSEVAAGSPAEAAGLLRGDEVLRVGDLAVATPLDIERGLLDVRPGQQSTIVVRRDGKEQSLQIEPQPLPKPNADPANDLIWQHLGLKLTQVSREYVQGVSSQFRGGLWVQAVAPNSPAARASIQKGDILVGMNVGSKNWETIRPDNLVYILRQPELRKAPSLLCYLVRRNEFVEKALSLGVGSSSSLRR